MTSSRAPTASERDRRVRGVLAELETNALHVDKALASLEQADRGRPPRAAWHDMTCALEASIDAALSLDIAWRAICTAHIALIVLDLPHDHGAALHRLRVSVQKLHDGVISNLSSDPLPRADVEALGLGGSQS
jgi:hypothetical protein